MLIEGYVLIEGEGVSEETLGVSLQAAKQVVIGSGPSEGEVILHLASNSHDYFRNALLEFAQLPGITGVSTLTLKIS